jgi:flagellar hook-basal body complex protein FliE
MSAEMISSVVAVGESAGLLEKTAAASITSAPASDFTQMVSQGLSLVNQQLLTSEAGLQQLASGHVENLHQVMIQLEEARLSFQLLLQVRTRLLEAYQDVMRMQI